jgi:hypothetical protein
MTVEENIKITKDENNIVQNNEFKLTISDYKKEEAENICKQITFEIEKHLQYFINKNPEINKMKCEYYVQLKCDNKI